MARASLKAEKKQPAKSKEQRAQSLTPPPTTHHPSPKEIPAVPQVAAPKISEPQPKTSQFVQEELPADFWERESIPVEAYEDEVPLESLPTSKTATPSKGQAASPIKHPLFAELQALFPGKIVRIETTKPGAKTGDDSKDESELSTQADQPLDDSESEGE